VHRVLKLQLDNLGECVDHRRLPLTLRPPRYVVAQINVDCVERSTIANLRERKRAGIRHGLESLAQDRRAAMYASESADFTLSDIELYISR
jgi:hypothetical protein